MTPLKKLLLGTTSLSIWNVAPRDPITIGNAILGAFAIETTSVAVIYAVGYLATTAVTSWALKALYPKPSAASMSSQGMLANAKDAAAAHEYVYGTVRKGGVITYLESTGASKQGTLCAAAAADRRAACTGAAAGGGSKKGTLCAASGTRSVNVRSLG